MGLATAPYFGLDHDNYMGALPQDNTPAASWPNFFITAASNPRSVSPRRMASFQTPPATGSNSSTSSYRQFLRPSLRRCSTATVFSGYGCSAKYPPPENETIVGTA